MHLAIDAHSQPRPRRPSPTANPLLRPTLPMADLNRGRPQPWPNLPVEDSVCSRVQLTWTIWLLPPLLAALVLCRGPIITTTPMIVLTTSTPGLVWRCPCLSLSLSTIIFVYHCLSVLALSAPCPTAQQSLRVIQSWQDAIKKTVEMKMLQEWRTKWTRAKILSLVVHTKRWER